MGQRILLATLGSFGDLHPFIAMARRLEERGHRTLIATSPHQREDVQRAGIAFHPIGPTREQVLQDLDMDVREFGRRTIRDVMFLLEAAVFPYLGVLYDDLLPLLPDSALMLSSTLLYSARLAAEKQRLPHLTVALQPMVFLSAHDPPAVDPAPWLAPILRQLGPAVTRAVYGPGKRAARRRARPLYEFRRKLGLPEDGPDPLFEGQFSERGTVAAYSPVFAAIQRDFPPHTIITGFPFYDRGQPGGSLAPELLAFLSEGPPPLVFTLGSFAVEFPGEFFQSSLLAARQMGRRAILVAGPGLDVQPSTDLFVSGYVPYSELFPHALAVVHQGGIGTTGQALRAGKPQLVIPFLGDQFDNASRLVRLGVARSFRRTRYFPQRVVRELTALLETPRYASEAATVGAQVGREDGAGEIARIVEAVLRSRGD